MIKLFHFLSGNAAKTYFFFSKTEWPAAKFSKLNPEKVFSANRKIMVTVEKCSSLQFYVCVCRQIRYMLMMSNLGHGNIHNTIAYLLKIKTLWWIPCDTKHRFPKIFFASKCKTQFMHFYFKTSSSQILVLLIHLSLGKAGKGETFHSPIFDVDIWSAAKEKFNCMKSHGYYCNRNSHDEATNKL